MAVLAYVGLGSNQGDRRASLDGALTRLSPRRVSTIVETEPWGRLDQGRFLNAVAEVDTENDAEGFLKSLLAVERDLGRERDAQDRWGPRTIDLDVLLFGDQIIKTESLTVPHPWLSRRRFVLEGLAELCPDRHIPGLDRTVRQLLEECD